ncbi:UNVERIFIED_CONTAM: Subtilisin-like protease SBT1.8 [Sesamum radiatum]|uniref:Subtilisin-like protease SBT1.8 n=1 Tax=Sesamum radiatum TaxID=300843 RepID=A0AAW2R3R4_SESRA
MAPAMLIPRKKDSYMTPSRKITLLSFALWTMEMIQAIVKRNVTCAAKFRDPGQLNYPSFSVCLGSLGLWYTRRLTNVGAAGSVYRVSVEAPPTVVVSVKPSNLVFKKVGDRQRYTVTFISQKGVDPLYNGFGSITWKNEQHQVRSPVAFSWSRHGTRHAACQNWPAVLFNESSTKFLPKHKQVPSLFGNQPKNSTDYSRNLDQCLVVVRPATSILKRREQRLEKGRCES